MRSGALEESRPEEGRASGGLPCRGLLPFPMSMERLRGDLADIAEGLLAPWRLSEAAAQAAADVKTADLLVIATPTCW